MTGHLVADDYNFNTDYYNNCRLISGYINATKLPPLFKEALKKYYADLIIRQGSEKNAGEEMNWLKLDPFRWNRGYFPGKFNASLAKRYNNYFKNRSC